MVSVAILWAIIEWELDDNMLGRRYGVPYAVFYISRARMGIRQVAAGKTSQRKNSSEHSPVENYI